MRQVAVNTRSWVFALSERERDFLVSVLQAYPALPRDYQPLSRESADRLGDEDRALLEESLLEHRAGCRSKVRRWLKGGARFRQQQGEWHFALSKTDFNWMMQVLNDVRVGHWLQLGSPDDIHNPIELLHRDPSAFFHMEAAGMFQMEFLAAVQQTPDSSGTE